MLVHQRVLIIYRFCLPKTKTWFGYCTSVRYIVKHVDNRIERLCSIFVPFFMCAFLGISQQILPKNTPRLLFGVNPTNQYLSHRQHCRVGPAPQPKTRSLASSWWNIIPSLFYGINRAPFNRNNMEQPRGLGFSMVSVENPLTNAFNIFNPHWDAWIVMWKKLGENTVTKQMSMEINMCLIGKSYGKSCVQHGPSISISTAIWYVIGKSWKVIKLHGPSWAIYIHIYGCMSIYIPNCWITKGWPLQWPTGLAGHAAQGLWGRGTPEAADGARWEAETRSGEARRRKRQMESVVGTCPGPASRKMASYLIVYLYIYIYIYIPFLDFHQFSLWDLKGLEGYSNQECTWFSWGNVWIELVDDNFRDVVHGADSDKTIPFPIWTLLWLKTWPETCVNWFLFLSMAGALRIRGKSGWSSQARCSSWAARIPTWQSWTGGDFNGFDTVERQVL